MSEEVGLPLEYFWSSRHQEATYGRGRILPAMRQVFEKSYQENFS